MVRMLSSRKRTDFSSNWMVRMLSSRKGTDFSSS
jgi:hypothetical protein